MLLRTLENNFKLLYCCIFIATFIFISRGSSYNVVRHHCAASGIKDRLPVAALISSSQSHLTFITTSKLRSYTMPPPVLTV